MTPSDAPPFWDVHAASQWIQAAGVLATLFAVAFSARIAVVARRDASDARERQEEAEWRERDTAERHRRDFVLKTLPYLSALENEHSYWERRDDGLALQVMLCNTGQGPALTQVVTLTQDEAVYQGTFDNGTVAPGVWVAAQFAGIEVNAIGPAAKAILECVYEDAFGGLSKLAVRIQLSDTNRRPDEPTMIRILGNRLTNETLDEISAELRLARELNSHVGM